MKTIQIIFFAFFFSASFAMAQDSLYINKAGAVTYKTDISSVDSITFQKVYPPMSSITIYNFDDIAAGTSHEKFPAANSNADQFFKASNTRATSGMNSLWAYDNYTGAAAVSQTPLIPTDKLTMEFNIYPESYSPGQYHGYSIVLASQVSSPAYANAINLIYFFNDGSVAYMTSSYGIANIFPAGTLKQGQWNQIKIAADVNGTTKMYINDSAEGIVGIAFGAAQYTTLRFGTTGGTTVGDSYYVDDVQIKNEYDATAIILSNILPIANNISLSCESNTSVNGTFSATDANGNTLTYTVIKQPNNGVLAVSGNTFIYTPNTGYVGRDLMWYVANDSFGKSNTAAIEVTVNGIMSQPIMTEGRFTIDITSADHHMLFPFLYRFGDHIFASYSEAGDVSEVGLKRSVKISHDNGLTWSTKHSNNNMYFTSMFEKDGLIYGIDYEPYLVTGEARAYEKMTYWTTADFGETWVKHEGRVNAPSAFNFQQYYANGSVYFHRDMMVMADGSIQGCMYGQWTDIASGQTEYGSVWAKSTDNAATWEIVSIIAKGRAEGKFTHWENFCEPAVTRVKDGSLLCVMRTGSYGPMYTCRSTDNGLTWSVPTTLPGLSREEAYSIGPQLLLMENGVLAMAYGRSGDLLAFSLDGSGHNWDYYYEVYTGRTEGMCGIVETEPGRLLYVGDQGREGTPEPRIWGTFINVNLAQRNFVDIAADLHAKKLSGITALEENAVGTTLYNFEDGTVGSAYSSFPTKTTANSTQFAKVTNQKYVSGSKALWFYDNNATQITVTETTFASTTVMDLEFKLYPETYSQDGYAFALASATGPYSFSNAINFIYFKPDGSVSYYNGSAAIAVLPAGTVLSGAWNDIKISAIAAGGTTISVNGSAAGSVGVWFAGSSYSAIRFCSAGGTPIGDSFYIDDVVFQIPMLNHHQPESVQ